MPVFERRLIKTDQVLDAESIDVVLKVAIVLQVLAEFASSRCEEFFWSTHVLETLIPGEFIVDKEAVVDALFARLAQAVLARLRVNEPEEHKDENDA